MINWPDPSVIYRISCATAPEKGKEILKNEDNFYVPKLIWTGVGGGGGGTYIQTSNKFSNWSQIYLWFQIMTALQDGQEHARYEP